MNTGVLIPTQGKRKNFLEFALKQIDRQTRKPDFIEVMADEQIIFPKDLTWRYRIGSQRLIDSGADIIIFWEDDDWYAPGYIERMVTEWETAGKPDIFGVGYSIYYHLFSCKFWKSVHWGRASAMSTMVKSSALKDYKWPDDSEVWLDIDMWKKIKGTTFEPLFPISIGIKHGLGVFGGIGHNSGFSGYRDRDSGFNYLRSMIGTDINFYKKIISERQP